MQSKNDDMRSRHFTSTSLAFRVGLRHISRMHSLPIDIVLSQLTNALRQHNAVVLQAPTGAGKTTRVPPALLDSGLPGTIVMIEPRRLAARAAARWMSKERGTKLGEEIGYHVRFDRCRGKQTRILVVTPGILLQTLHNDPFLESTGTVIFDEFHERGLESDLLLGMVRLMQQTVRPELRIVVMSATLATEKISNFLGGCLVMVSAGRQFPVEIVYDAKPTSQPWPIAVAAATVQMLDRTPGDLLVFLPGLQEIRQTAHHLESLVTELDLAILPLHGDLPAEQQDVALLPGPRRKVVLATNVAETSVTVEGVTGVIDTGLARMQQFDARVGLDRLRLTPISQASADQRAGRAGRTQPGICLRLWSEASHRQRTAETEPEIRRVDLAGATLQLMCLGEKEIGRFPWLDQPPPATVAQSLKLLERLGAVNHGGVTDLGRQLARLPVHPRLGRLLLDGQLLGDAEGAALAAALLSERDPFMRSEAGRPPGLRNPSHSDVLDRVEALEAFERGQEHASHLGTLNRHAAHFVLRARDQMLRELHKSHGGKSPPSRNEDALPRALLAAFPDRVVRRREPNSQRGLMVGGRGVVLAHSSAVTEPELFLAIDLDAARQQALVRLASAIRREWLPADRVTTAIEVEFDEKTERISARKRVRYEDLLLEESPAALPEGDPVATALATAAAQHLDRVLPAEDSPAGNYLLRLRCLQQWMPELNLPPCDDAALRDLLPWLCPGRRSFEEIRNADWLAALQSRMTHVQRQAVEREAPERLQVPSGSHITLKYELGRPPVLAVRIQELFGLTETPRLGGNRVRVLFHLLAPNYRPQQVTDDLASFWTNTYPQVRKDLRARYPKHAWPEDPWKATASQRPKR
ncbi:MAG TPA: ATP-dependent helicase HrpB [Gemmataceae bacterium]|nr:ATP-dependent helicase HrpB [Gemmataceae bacterium]